MSGIHNYILSFNSNKDLIELYYLKEIKFSIKSNRIVLNGCNRGNLEELRLVNGSHVGLYYVIRLLKFGPGVPEISGGGEYVE